MSDSLDRATEQLRATPVPPGPPAELMAATVAAVADRAKPIHILRRKRIMRIAGYGTAGTLAAGVLVAVGVLWVGSGSARALDEALKKATGAKSVRVTASAEKDGRWTAVQTVTKQGNMVRVERPYETLVLDLASREQLTLDPNAKTARQSQVDERTTGVVGNVLGGLEAIKAGLAGQEDKANKPVGFDDLRSVRAARYEMKSARPPGVWTVWTDPKSELPMRVQLAAGDTGRATFRIDFERWNEDFDPKLFALDVPDGYTLTDADGSPKRDKGERFVVFRAAVDAPEKAKSFRAVIRQKTAGAKETEQKLFSQGGKLRMEFGPDIVSIADTAAKTVVVLDGKSKVARVMDLGGPEADLPKNVAAAVKTVLDRNGVEDLGDKDLDGRKTRAYRVKGLDVGGGKWDVNYWIDAERKLPFRIEMAGTAGAVAMTQTTEYFGFDEELDPKLFDQTIPEGYKVEKFDRDAILKQLREKATPAPPKKVEPIAPTKPKP